MAPSFPSLATQSPFPGAAPPRLAPQPAARVTARDPASAPVHWSLRGPATKSERLEARYGRGSRGRAAAERNRERRAGQCVGPGPWCCRVPPSSEVRGGPPPSSLVLHQGRAPESGSPPTHPGGWLWGVPRDTEGQPGHGVGWQRIVRESTGPRKLDHWRHLEPRSRGLKLNPAHSGEFYVGVKLLIGCGDFETSPPGGTLPRALTCRSWNSDRMPLTPECRDLTGRPVVYFLRRLRALPHLVSFTAWSKTPADHRAFYRLILGFLNFDLCFQVQTAFSCLG